LPTGVRGYDTRQGGTGFVQPVQVVTSQVVARPEGGAFQVSLDYGFAELGADFAKTLKVTLSNIGDGAATFNVAQGGPLGRPHTIGLDKASVTVPAHGTADVMVTLNVPVSTVGPSYDIDTAEAVYGDVA